MKQTGLLLMAFATTLIAGCRTNYDGPASHQGPPPQVPRLRLVILQDVTGSMKEAHTQPITVEELQAAIELIRSRGGELGFGLIGEQSDRSLLRLAIEPPPVAPPEPSEPSNPLRRPRWQREHQEWEQARQRNEQRWKEETEKRKQAFLAEAQRRLEAPVAGRSDICGGIRRGDLMLAEPFSGGHIAFLMLITDGLHNVRGSDCPKTLSSSARLLLVNGAGILGVVGKYKPTRFESVRAALEFIRYSLEEKQP